MSQYIRYLGSGIRLGALLAATLLVLQPVQARETKTHGKLKGKRVAILVADGFEQVEMVEPRKALDEPGAKTVLISPRSGEVKAWDKDRWGKKYHVDMRLADARPEHFDALLLPGGVMNSDRRSTRP